MAERDTYKYHLKQGKKVVHRGIVYHRNWAVASLTLLVRNDTLRSGFTAKSIWDVLEALAVPLTVVLIAGVMAARTQRSSQREELDRELADQQFQITTLQAFLDQMTGRVVSDKLGADGPQAGVRAVARAHTFAVLRRR